jgi:flagellar hook-associated protein 3 FlgL
MKVTPTFLIASLARSDVSRITSQLYDLQRQTGSGFLADDLRGYGDNAGRIISARSVVEQTEARKAAAQRLQTRLDVQDAALDKAASTANQLKLEVTEAITSDNGTFLAERLRTAFGQMLGAMNQTYEGVALFSGERRGTAAIRVAAIEDLPAALTDAQVFNESTREQTVDLGFGASFRVAEKASAISGEMFDSMRELYGLLQGGGFGNPLTATERGQLTDIAEGLEVARASIVEAQGRNGDANARLGREVERLTGLSSMVENHMDQIAGADLAEVSMRIAATNTQYQAIAKVFSDIRNLTLVNFLD